MPVVPATAVHAPFARTLTKGLNIASASSDATDRRAQSLVRRILLDMIDDPTPP
jgi:hypothetical protein